MSEKDKKKSIKPPKKAGKDFGAYKRFLLLIASVLLLLGFYMLPANKAWITTRILPYALAIPQQLKKLDIETRKKERYGYGYHMYDFLKTRLGDSGVFLIPPQAYLVKNTFSEKNQESHLWVYPSLLYYHIEDIRLVDMKSGDERLRTATHTYWINDRKEIVLLPIDNETTRTMVLDTFGKYELTTFFSTQEAFDWLKKERK